MDKSNPNRSFDQGKGKISTKIMQENMVKMVPIQLHKEEDIVEEEELKEEPQERESIGEAGLGVEQKTLIKKLFYSSEENLTLNKEESSLIKDLLLCMSLHRCS